MSISCPAVLCGRRKAKPQSARRRNGSLPGPVPDHGADLDVNRVKVKFVAEGLFQIPTRIAAIFELKTLAVGFDVHVDGIPFWEVMHRV